MGKVDEWSAGDWGGKGRSNDEREEEIMEEIWLSLCAILFWREVRGLRCGCGGVVLVVILMMLLLSCAPSLLFPRRAASPCLTHPEGDLGGCIH